MSVLDLPDHLAAKADAQAIGADEEHLDAIATSLEHTVGELERRLDEARHAPGGIGTEALERDQEVHRLTARLRTMRRFGVDLCLGRMVTDAGEAVYVGRLGLTGQGGERLLVDWRSPAAEPFFGATHADPMGLASRRRYRWHLGRITDYWDEVFSPDGLEGNVALDDQSAFIASLGADRSDRMRDVLGTIQADQDAIIRAGSAGALVVDGGPGTGKTVVALHRTAYLTYSDPRFGQGRGGVLVVGPHQPYLAYVSDVLPSLGEDGVQTCTIRDLVPEGAEAVPEQDADVARLKASAAMVGAIEPAVALYEEAPTRPMTVETPWSDVHLGAADWAEAFAAADPGAPHNEARDEVWEELLTILVDQHEKDDDLDPDDVRRSLEQDADLVDAFGRAWPIIEPTDLVGDLWEVPAYLRRCAPWLTPEEVQRLRREPGSPWTVSDLPLLDAARRRLGDPEASRRRRREAAAVAADRARMARVVDDLITTARETGADELGEGLVTMLRAEDLQESLVDPGVRSEEARDALAGTFAHVVVDEAQELTDAEWQMLLPRCPTRSFTIVGDRAQARHGFTESWEERLQRVGLDLVERATLSINYRTPEEIMSAAEPVIRAVLPDANVPTSVRSTGMPVEHRSRDELQRVIDEWLAEPGDGTACVIAAEETKVPLPSSGRVRSLTPTLAKGLEFDLVVLLEPEAWGDDYAHAVDRYVAMTRATQRLVVVS